MDFVAHTDGACVPNPGFASCAFILKDVEGRELEARAFYLGDGHTSNEAEYCGILRAVEAALARGATRLDIFTDSNLTVQQLSGKWKLKAENLKDYHGRIMAALAKIPSWRIQWVPRAMNQACDTLAGNAVKLRRDLDYSDREILEPRTYAERIRCAVGDYLKRKPPSRQWRKARRKGAKL